MDCHALKVAAADENWNIQARLTLKIAGKNGRGPSRRVCTDNEAVSSFTDMSQSWEAVATDELLRLAAQDRGTYSYYTALLWAVKGSQFDLRSAAQAYGVGNVDSVTQKLSLKRLVQLPSAQVHSSSWIYVFYSSFT